MSPNIVSEFYTAHHPWLTGWLRMRLGCSFTAADISHDTFVNLLGKSIVEPIHEPRAYLKTVAHGLMVNHVRRRDLESAYLELLASKPEAHYPSPELLATVIETLVAVDAMLKGLPPKVRKTFLLLQVDGLSHAEIAKKLNVSVSSVGQYAAKAMMHCMRYKELID